MSCSTEGAGGPRCIWKGPCSLRYANAYYYQQTFMGSGLDARPGNLAQEFGLALTAVH